ncbi:MAG: FAD-dependent oxidoreductase [Hyphomicrobiales bacterium]|nr:FAD-dependent oxidoreductase [Hyphomicrobiales bacterium]
MTQRVAVIGAGLAGLACARVLRRGGCFVEVFEQDRIIGGRTSTTRVGMTSFDHGAQYVTGRSPTFMKFVSELVETGYAARWQPRTSTGAQAATMAHWHVGTPGMSSILRPLAEGVRITTGRRVHTLRREDKGWRLWFEDESSVGPYHAVAVAVPAREALLLLGQFDTLSDPISRVRMQPCWAVMIRLEDRIMPDQDVFSDMSETIRWMARNNAKPGRNSRGDHVVIHASPGWSRETEDTDPEVVAEELWAEVSHALSLPPTRPAQISAYLWRSGLVETALGESCLFSSHHMVGVAGDWCLGRLAEHAYDSGTRLGRAIIDALA